MENVTQEIIEKYEKRNSLYKDFCFSVKNVIKNLLGEHGYKFHIQHRIKSIKSLKEKVERKQRQGKRYKRLSDIEDLAAIRVIFYLNSDIEKFAKEINREISGIVKIRKKRNLAGYQATHLVISLGEKRLQLNEYRKFRGLKCEIQLTSLLNHAWSEIEHDIFYKKRTYHSFLDGKDILKEKKRMKKIMSHYLINANDEFERIVKKMTKRK